MYTHNYYKRFLLFTKKIYNYIKKIHHTIIKKKFSLLNIRMVNPRLNLSLNESRLIAEHRNMSDCKIFGKST